MKKIIFILLISFPMIAFSEAILTDNIKINVIKSFHKSTITSLWHNDSDFFNVKVQLNIENVIKVVIKDNNPICKSANKQLFLFTSKKPLLPESFNISIKTPCIIERQGSITIHIQTLEKKFFYNKLVFDATYNSQL